MTPAPDTGRTAEENELREALADTIGHALVEAGLGMAIGVGVFELVADRLLSGPLAPILQEAATARKERDEARTSLEECAALVSEYAAAAIPEGMEILAKDRDKWFDAAQAAEAEAAHLRAENAHLRDRVREAEGAAAEVAAWKRVAVIAAIPLEAMRMGGSYRTLAPSTQTCVDEAIVTIRMAVAGHSLPPAGDLDASLAPARAALSPEPQEAGDHEPR